jgi:hypothetical protein
MSYLGMAIGSLAGLFVVYFGSDRISEALTKKHGSPSAEVPSCLALLTAVSACIALLGTVPVAPWPNDIWVGCRVESTLVDSNHGNFYIRLWNFHSLCTVPEIY